MKAKLKSLVASVSLLAQRVWAMDSVRRVVHTFWQTFLAVWAVSGFALNKVAFVSAVAAGLAAAKALVVKKVRG
jgi:hypothetical protein